MALIACYECSKEISDTAQSCPGCGAPVKRPNKPTGSWKPTDQATNSLKSLPPKRMVSLPFFLGLIAFAPITVWFLLRKGHSTQSRVIGFAWLFIFIFWLPLGSQSPNRAQVASSASTTSSPIRPADEHPESLATYAQVNAEVGCKSSYSDQKKDDIFKAKYKDHWMTWSGQIALLESDEVSLNVDHIGTQDLQVDFADKQAGYNLAKGSELKVRFLMKSAGGCFLPFGGKEATVVR